MSATTWYFLRDPPQGLRPAACALIEDFCFGRRPIMPDADGMVRCAEVVVRLENRAACEVLRIGFFQYRARAGGLIDPEHMNLVMSTVAEAAFPDFSAKHEPGVIDAGRLFARRRLEHLSHWRPTKAEMVKLIELINQKAGWRLV